MAHGGQSLIRNDS